MQCQPELSAAYARLILQSGAAAPEALLSGSGLQMAALATLESVDATALATIFCNYDRVMADPCWPVHLGNQFSIAAHGALGFAALSAPTLGDALDVMGTLYHSRTTAVAVEVLSTDTEYIITMHDLTGDQQFSERLAAMVLKILESLIATIIGHPVGSNVVISLTQRAPPHAPAMAAAYGATVRFGCEIDAISIPINWCRLPSPLYDEAVFRSNVIKCREAIAAREQRGRLGLAVRNMLENHFDMQLLDCAARSDAPTLAHVADQLHLTTRTLIRRLAREDTAFKVIMESLRKELAARLLLDARLTVAEVGEVLGYREPANFGRAFRRWYGASPSAWRRR